MEQLLGTSQIALGLGICQEGVRRLIRRGDLRASLIGGLYKVKPQDLDKLLEDRKVNQSKH